jgi:transcriptional regulator with XRE-family HTH domain
MTLNQVGDALKVSSMTVQRFETGTRNVSLKWLEKLAQLYGVRVAELVDEIDPASLPPGLDVKLLEEILDNAQEYCAGKRYENKDLSRVIAITYNRCMEDAKKQKKPDIREKVEDMLALVAEAY